MKRIAWSVMISGLSIGGHWSHTFDWNDRSKATMPIFEACARYGKLDAIPRSLHEVGWGFDLDALELGYVRKKS